MPESWNASGAVNEMNEHTPNLEMLTAWLDGLLSPDAARSMQQHVASCEACADALERERTFLATLDGMCADAPPDDFVAAVMGRVAQYPAHRPPAPVPWQQVVRWATAASVVFGVMGLATVAWVFGSGMVEGSGLAARAIGGGASLMASTVATARDAMASLGVLLEEAGELLWRIANLAVRSGWLVQSTLLLVTVSLNYAFTRLVLNYQRRH